MEDEIDATEVSGLVAAPAASGEAPSSNRRAWWTRIALIAVSLALGVGYLAAAQPGSWDGVVKFARSRVGDAFNPGAVGQGGDAGLTSDPSLTASTSSSTSSEFSTSSSAGNESSTVTTATTGSSSSSETSSLSDLLPHITLSNCSSDQLAKALQEYAVFHAAGVAKLRAGEPAPPIIVYFCPTGHFCKGIGDRFAGLASAYMFALKFNRLFFIIWPEVESNFLPTHPLIDWRWNSTYDPLGRCVRMGPMAEELKNRGRYAPTISSDGRGLRRYKTACVLYTGNRGPWLLRGAYKYSKEHQSYVRQFVGPLGDGPTCLMKSLLTPNAALWKRAGEILQPMTTAMEGVVRATVAAGYTPQLLRFTAHVRIGDSTLLGEKASKGSVSMGSSDSVGKCLVKRASEMDARAIRGEKGAPLALMFVLLSSDDSSLASRFNTVLPDELTRPRVGKGGVSLPPVVTVVRPDTVPVHVDLGEYKIHQHKGPTDFAARVRDTFAEWLLLGGYGDAGNVAIVSLRSGYARSAVILSGARIDAADAGCKNITSVEAARNSAGRRRDLLGETL